MLPSCRPSKTEYFLHQSYCFFRISGASSVRYLFSYTLSEDLNTQWLKNKHDIENNPTGSGIVENHIKWGSEEQEDRKLDIATTSKKFAGLTDFCRLAQDTRLWRATGVYQHEPLVRWWWHNVPHDHLSRKDGEMILKNSVKNFC